MIPLKWLVIYSIYFSHFLVNAQSNVVFTTILFRHGDRIPIDPYPTDPWRNLTLWPAPAWGQLTNKGKREHFELGKSFRQRYKHLLSDQFFPNEIYVQSSDYDRTIMSAQCHLAGMYPTSDKTEWNPDIHWQPIPVHVIPQEYDDLLMQSTCSMFDYELAKLFETEPFKEVDKELAPLYEYLTLHTGKNVNTMKEVSRIYDTLKIEDLYNFTLPAWTKSVYPDQMRAVSVKCFYTETYNKVLKKLKAGPLVKKITENLKEAAKGSLGKNIIIYSGHDTVIANVLNALNLYDGIPPPYGSNILFDLIIEKNVPYVQISYQGKVLTIPDCGSLCPLSKWIDIYNWLIPNDHVKDCMLNEEDFAKFIWQVSYGVATVFLAVMAVVLILARRKKNNITDILTINGNTKSAYKLMY